jgi:hypothetical protein
VTYALGQRVTFVEGEGPRLDGATNDAPSKAARQAITASADVPPPGSSTNKKKRE